ncbi:unnamed protein product, partial [Iphiclides podalirius]
MAETIEETYESAVTRKVVRKSLKIEEVSNVRPRPPNGRHTARSDAERRRKHQTRHTTARHTDTTNAKHSTVKPNMFGNTRAPKQFDNKVDT